MPALRDKGWKLKKYHNKRESNGFQLGMTILCEMLLSSKWADIKVAIQKRINQRANNRVCPQSSRTTNLVNPKWSQETRNNRSELTIPWTIWCSSTRTERKVLYLIKMGIVIKAQLYCQMQPKTLKAQIVRIKSLRYSQVLENQECQSRKNRVKRKRKLNLRLLKYNNSRV